MFEKFLVSLAYVTERTEVSAALQGTQWFIVRQPVLSGLYQPRKVISDSFKTLDIL